MENTHSNTRKVVWGLAAAAFVVLVLGIIGVVKPFGGYGRSGTIVLTGIHSTERIFVDNETQSSEQIASGRQISVIPGTRDILISKDGSWPWLKQVTILDDETITLSPLLLPQKPETEEITQDDPEYDALLNLSRLKSLPTKPHVLLSSDHTVTVWEDKNFFKAAWLGSDNPPRFFCISACKPEITFLKSAVPIKSIAFWKNRNDVVLFAQGTDLYALELDQHPIQNIQLVYRGTNPTFAFTDGGALYVHDNDHLYHLIIDK